MLYRGLAITGTGTGVGKTTVAAALARLFREAGLKVGVLKPVETGCAGPDLIPADALALAEAAGIVLSIPGQNPPAPGAISLDDVVPWRFRAPLAPEEAARLEGRTITVDRVYQAMDRWMERADLVLVETAGGLLVPLNPNFTFAELLQGLGVPVLVVAPNQLGVINHALLTLEAIERRGLSPIGLVLNALDPQPDLSARSNADVIRRRARLPVYQVPHSAPPHRAVDDALRPHRAELRAALDAEWRKAGEKFQELARRHGGHGEEFLDGGRS